MSARPAFAAAVAEALGAAVVAARPIAGGDINDAYELRLADGREVFAKTNDRAPQAMFQVEARGLAWLAEAAALRIPRVLAVSPPGGPPGAPLFLALELVRPGPRAHGFDEALGRGLAALHRAGAPAFGLDHDNFVGRLPQANAPAADWPTFYRERRLEPLLRRARDAGLVDASLHRRADALLERLADLVGPPEPPARLHGDLWAGNLLVDETGAPCLVDPAVYGGHREIDLAMMRLFGGFSARTFAAYDEASPLADGHEDRVPLYQLYPLLVHVGLFGASYVPQVAAAIARLG